MLFYLPSKEEFQVIGDRLTEIIDRLNDLEFETKSKSIYSNEELAIKLEVSKKTLKKWRDEGKIAFTKIGRKIFYTQDELSDFLKSFNYKTF
jgi:excisionase family DNA binding protein